MATSSFGNPFIKALAAFSKITGLVQLFQKEAVSNIIFNLSGMRI
jgi:hypothetical protein